MQNFSVVQFTIIVVSTATLMAQPARISPSSPAAPSSSIATMQPPVDYVLHINDTLEMQFPFSPEYSETVIVQPDGQIGLREANPVTVAGKSIAAAQATIVEAYRGTLKDPSVSILLKNFLSPSFYASGEIGRPGRYDLRSGTTLLQALAECGGLINERAKKTQVLVLRPQGDASYESHLIDVKELLKPRGRTENYPIFPGDIIYVPQNRFSKISRYIPTANVGTYASNF